MIPNITSTYQNFTHLSTLDVTSFFPKATVTGQLAVTAVPPAAAILKTDSETKHNGKAEKFPSATLASPNTLFMESSFLAQLLAQETESSISPEPGYSIASYQKSLTLF